MRTLEIHQIELNVHLGCQDDERKETQKVEVSIQIHFAQAPEAELSDELADTYCYAKITEQMQLVAQAKPYKLIEHLAFSLTQQLKQVFGLNDFSLTVHKLKPPIEAIKGGTSYTVHATSQNDTDETVK